MGQMMLILHGLKPAMLMVMVQVALAGVNVLYKFAADDGMSLRIIVAYRFLFATAVMVPLALIVQRKRPKLTWTILLQAFLCALLGGSLSQNMYIESLALTSATFVCAMTNLTPAITFIVAITIGLEKLAFRTIPGKAKVLGTVIGIGGAMLLTFYKGPEINIATHVDLLPHGRHGFNSSNAAPTHQLVGALLAFACCICYALWLNIQAKMSKKYPCYYSSTALICVIGTVQVVAFALCMEKDMSQWRLGWNIRLLTVAYSGIFGFGLTFSLISWGHTWSSADCDWTLRCIMGEKQGDEEDETVPSPITFLENKAIEIVVASSLDDDISIINNDNSIFVTKDSLMK